MHQLEFHPQVVLAERPPVPLTIPRHIQKKQYAPNRFFVIQEISFFLFYSMELLWRMQKKLPHLIHLYSSKPDFSALSPQYMNCFSLARYCNALRIKFIRFARKACTPPYEDKAYFCKKYI